MLVIHQQHHQEEVLISRGGGSATGNASYAWISGAWDWIYGTAGPNASVVDRIDFANDSNTALARGNLDRAVGKVAASGNANYGWWYGGSGSNSFGDSSVSRVDYGSDTATASPKGTLPGNVNSNTAGVILTMDILLEGTILILIF